MVAVDALHLARPLNWLCGTLRRQSFTNVQYINTSIDCLLSRLWLRTSLSSKHWLVDVSISGSPRRLQQDFKVSELPYVGVLRRMRGSR